MSTPANHGLVRETAHQSRGDLEFIARSDELWSGGSASVAQKLEAFTKFVSRQSLTKLLARYELFKLQLATNGSIVEVGVHRGASLMAWAHFSSILEPVNYLRQVIGFDTFEGFPAVGEQDRAGSSEHLKQGGFDTGEDAYADLLRAIELYDVNRLMGHIPKVQLVRGDVTHTLPRYLEENPHLVVSLLHLDADLYEPTRATLSQLLPRMPKGAVVAFDELNMKLFPGETLATMEAIGLPRLRLQRFPFATSLSYAVLE